MKKLEERQFHHPSHPVPVVESSEDLSLMISHNFVLFFYYSSLLSLCNMIIWIHIYLMRVIMMSKQNIYIVRMEEVIITIVAWSLNNSSVFLF